MLAAFGGLLWAVIQILSALVSLLINLVLAAALVTVLYARFHPNPGFNNRLVDRVRALADRCRR